MTRTRYRIFETEYPYFLTCTIVGWIPVFTRPEAVEIVLDSWRFLQQQRQFRLYGYVILENHLHLIASGPHLANDIKSFKMFTARQIVDLLEHHVPACFFSSFAILSSRTRRQVNTRSGRKAACRNRF